MKRDNKISIRTPPQSKSNSKAIELQKEQHLNKTFPLESSFHFLSENGHFFYLCPLF